MLNGLVGMYQALDDPSYRLPPATQTRFLADCNAFILHYRALHLAALGASIKRWHEVPKFHYVMHAIALSYYMNPRWAWNYADEDFMRIVKAFI